MTEERNGSGGRSVASGGTRPVDIVVALDGSSSSAEALAWAAQQARLTGHGLRAVHVTGHDRPAVWTPDLTVGAYVLARPENEVSAELRAMFDAVQPEPGWTLDVVTGSPGPELVRQTAGAAMLVLGTQEHVGLGRLLVGSVSHYCLAHAHCPVVAVPSGFAVATAVAATPRPLEAQREVGSA